MTTNEAVNLQSLDEVLKTEDIAVYLRVHVLTVRRWINSGQLKAFKAGHSYRVNRVDLIDFLTKKDSDDGTRI